MNNNFFLLLLHSLCIFLTNADNLVHTTHGTLKGIVQVSRNGRKYSAFLGIRYAKSPIGELRFANPQPAEGWAGIRSATSFGNMCIQIELGLTKGQEDCLFLNVYTPRLEFSSSSANNTLLPVMVWIHGGAFIGGSSNIFSAKYILDKDVILVTINYRLGIFGFLSTGDSAAPGNFGMKDQILALKWVQQNIKSFGGDPNKVTIFGESAGGVSVALHAISKASTGLFQKYIIQSGANLVPWGYQQRSNYNTLIRQIAASVFCPFFTSRSIVTCLRTRDASHLLSTSSTVGTFARGAQLMWVPTDEPEHDGAFLTDSPKNLLANNQMKDLPFMSGDVADEGLLITQFLFLNKALGNTLKFSLDPIIAGVAHSFVKFGDEYRFTAAAKNFYFNNTSYSNENSFLESLTKFLSDAFFHYPQVKMLEKVVPRMKSSSYFYNFGYRGTISLYSGVRNNPKIGVGHSEEVMYLLPFPLPINFNYNNKEDTLISQTMVDMWTSFAINGKPTSNKLSSSDLWKPYTSANTNYLQIGNINNNKDPSISLSNTFYKDRMNFWRKNAPI